MPNESRRPNAPRGFGAPSMPMEGERELIVVTRAGAPLQPTAEGFAPPSHADSDALNKVLSAAGATMRPLFDVSPTRARQAAAIADLLTPPGAAPAPDLTTFLRVDAADEQLDRLVGELRDLPTVEAAYVKPAAVPAMSVKTPVGPHEAFAPTSRESAPDLLNAMIATPEEAPPTTPDFTPLQAFLDPAPAGVDARFAWTQLGGRGANVNVIDVEGAWRFTHEDLKLNQGGVAFGTPINDIGWRNHGTAVLGVISGDLNGLGITGIAPDAFVRGASISAGSAAAIHKAADLLNAGDIILIELHRAGPHATGAGQVGFIAIEWWPDDFAAIQYATSRGVIVVEAAGNGGENLDDPIYDRPGAGFPASWSNPFRRGARDSGAILVGAGAPPPGTHGHDHGPDRSRLAFSNYGSAVDAQGWGREVTTTGYGDLQGGSNEDLWYTNQFSGTSSASPIVVGALACAQGNRHARTTTLLTPVTARQLLRNTGSPQQDAPGRPVSQRIGTRPNLRQMIPVFVLKTTPLFRYWNPKITDHFYTANFAELERGRNGWVLEGIAGYVSPARVVGMVPLHRYWNPTNTDHFYTTNWGELGRGKYGYAYEGIAGWVYPQRGVGRAALLRYWNAAIGDHFYTTNRNELGSGRNGYVYEGIACWIATTVRPPLGDESPELASTPAPLPELEIVPEMDTGSLVEAALVGVPELSEAELAEDLPVPSTFATRVGSLAGDLPAASLAIGTEMPGRAVRKGGVTITIRMQDDES